MDALPSVIAEKLSEVRTLCEKYSVRKLTIFGSAVKGTFDPEKSDLDFVVEFEWHPDPLERGRRWLELWDDLRDLFERNVDLLVASTIENPYLLAQIDLAHIDVYAA
ncbi:MAG TPA: nucleotidyltransferase domain-containing protein [Thermoanaerobaculia bacterium]|nr:nucleotidyltransferase domain-containing protein [Thermoanaerobaculia bacterium]